MSMKVVSKIKLYQEARKKDILGKDYYKINCSEDVANLGRHFLRGDIKESMIVAALSTSHDVIAVYTIYSGTINAMMVSPREVLQFALLNNATSLVLMHNHPSGNLQPSDEDVKFSKRLSMASELLHIDLLDHVVVTDDDYTSIRSIHPGIFASSDPDELEAFVADEVGAYR